MNREACLSLNKQDFSTITLNSTTMILFSLSSFEAGQYVDFQEVVCITGDGNYSYICLNDGRRLLVSKCLEQLEPRLPRQQFLRIHKRIKLTDGKVYTVARRRWPRINSYFKKKVHRER